MSTITINYSTPKWKRAAGTADLPSGAPLERLTEWLHKYTLEFGPLDEDHTFTYVGHTTQGYHSESDLQAEWFVQGGEHMQFEEYFYVHPTHPYAYCSYVSSEVLGFPTPTPTDPRRQDLIDLMCQSGSPDSYVDAILAYFDREG
jgi:hypothetical protein